MAEIVTAVPFPSQGMNPNLGREHALTTFLSYGEVGYQRQGDLIRDLVNASQRVTLAKDPASMYSGTYEGCWSNEFVGTFVGIRENHI